MLQFQPSQGRQTEYRFPQGTYMVQNFIYKTSTILYSITKEFSKIYQVEREQWLSEVLQKCQSSSVYSFIFIRSGISENDKNVPLCRYQFHP